MGLCAMLQAIRRRCAPIFEAVGRAGCGLFPSGGPFLIYRESDSQPSKVDCPQRRSLMIDIDAVGIALGIALVVVLEITFFWAIADDL